MNIATACEMIFSLRSLCVCLHNRNSADGISGSLNVDVNKWPMGKVGECVRWDPLTN